MQQARAEALLVDQGWKLKMERRPLQRGGVSKRLYAAKTVHICNVVQLPALSSDEMGALLREGKGAAHALSVQDGAARPSSQDIELALSTASHLALQLGWKAFVHRVGGQRYFCVQKTRYLCLFERLAEMEEAQFRQLLQRKLPVDELIPRPSALDAVPGVDGNACSTPFAFPSVASVLAQAFDPQVALPQSVLVPPGTLCAQSGVPLTEGIALKYVLSPNSADLADTFPFYDTCEPSAESMEPAVQQPRRGRPGRRGALAEGVRPRYVSQAVARVYGSRFSGNLLVADGRGYRPLINAAYASEERPRWRDLILHTLREGMLTVAILTHESQKRLWPRAAVSYVGPNWQVLLDDEHSCRLLCVDFGQLRSCLLLVEQIYQAGFSKDAICTSLFARAKRLVIAQVGMEQVSQWEQDLSRWRAGAAFPIAIFVAQREE